MSNSNPRDHRRSAETPTADIGEIENNTYNDQAGVRKTSDFGKALKPLKLAENSFTTDFTTARILQKGTALAIYNNGAAAAITFSNTSIAALGIGATNTSGDVGIALPANSWTYLNNYDKRYAITSNASAIVYVIEDDTYVVLRK